MDKKPVSWLLVYGRQCPSHLEPVRKMYFRYNGPFCYPSMFFPQELNPIQTYAETKEGFLGCAEGSAALPRPSPSLSSGRAGRQLSLSPGLRSHSSEAKSPLRDGTVDIDMAYVHHRESQCHHRCHSASARGTQDSGPSRQCSLALQLGCSVSGDGSFGSGIPSDGLTCPTCPTILPAGRFW